MDWFSFGTSSSSSHANTDLHAETLRIQLFLFHIQKTPFSKVITIVIYE